MLLPANVWNLHVKEICPPSMGPAKYCADGTFDAESPSIKETDDFPLKIPSYFDKLKFFLFREALPKFRKALLEIREAFPQILRSASSKG